MQYLKKTYKATKSICFLQHGCDLPIEACIALLITQAFTMGNKEGPPHLVLLAKMSSDYGCSVKAETHTG